MPKKPDNRSCLKNIKMVKDEHGLDREIGEVDLSYIRGRNDLGIVFTLSSSKCFECEDKGSYIGTTMEFYKDKEDASYSYTDIMKKYDSVLKEKGKGSKDVFDLLYNYFVSIQGDSNERGKRHALSDLLAATCKWRYIDIDFNEIKKNNPPIQSGIDHDSVEYKLVMCKPIPLEILVKMKDYIVSRKLDALKEDPKYNDLVDIEIRI